MFDPQTQTFYLLKTTKKIWFFSSSAKIMSHCSYKTKDFFILDAVKIFFWPLPLEEEFVPSHTDDTPHSKPRGWIWASGEIAPPGIFRHLLKSVHGSFLPSWRFLWGRRSMHADKESSNQLKLVFMQESGWSHLETHFDSLLLHALWGKRSCDVKNLACFHWSDCRDSSSLNKFLKQSS